MKTTFLIFIISLITHAKVKPNPLPFLTEGRYEALKNQNEICQGGNVEFHRKQKFLEVGAIFNFPVVTRAQERKDPYNPGCRLTENYKVEQFDDHTQLHLLNRSLCRQGSKTTRTEVKIYRDRIEAVEIINGKPNICIWKKTVPSQTKTKAKSENGTRF